MCINLAQFMTSSLRRKQEYQMQALIYNASLPPIMLGKVSGILWWTLELLFSFFPN